MKMIVFRRILILIALIAASTFYVAAEMEDDGKVRISYDKFADGGIKVVVVWNDTDKKIDLKIDGKVFTVLANSSYRPNQAAYKYVRYDFATGAGGILWKPAAPAETVKEDKAEEGGVTAAATQPAESPKEGRPEDSMPQPVEIVVAKNPSQGYAEILHQDTFFGTDAVGAFVKRADELCRGIELAKNKHQYIVDNDIAQFLAGSAAELKEKREALPSIAEDIIMQSKIDSATNVSTASLILETLNSRLKTREDAYNRLNSIVEEVNGTDPLSAHAFGDDILNYCIVGGIILVLIILIIVVVSRKKSSRKSTGNQSKPAASSGNQDIVVRRRTMSILKKQCIDDVKDNPGYLMIDSRDFTPDSAIGRIYIKNSCIKEVYNLYAEDLRNSENPNEDGCMVLGRWVYDPEAHTYDVSLEEVVFPGDDAVFKEYELNFGGKIKLRIAERLRKLRRDTNLQYDLVCWIHSHPGLGVFFSNSDDNVQMQLKHTQHPNFLIAFVVDILTSGQETGIFTFRKDGSMNSKGDLTKMYSLEELYKWALESERNTFSHENYFNILGNAKLRVPSCMGVELNNNAIIDLTQIVIEPETGIVGWAIGTTVESKSGEEYAVSGIARNSEKPAAGITGCLISMSYMSLPTIQRLIARDRANLSFVMVYSSKQMSLTTIPVINGELLSDEQFYSDVNIEDLKIWTRRKR